MSQLGSDSLTFATSRRRMSSVKPRWRFALMLCFARVAKEHRRKICKRRVWWRRYFSGRPATCACRRELVDGGGEAIDTASGYPSAWKWLHHSKVSSNFIELVSITDRKRWSELWLFSSWAERATTCKIGLWNFNGTMKNLLVLKHWRRKHCN